jgi:16S rRNA (cytosine967-C5)-methyltransferase
MDDRGAIVALDRRAESLRRLREESRRLGVATVETRLADAAALPEGLRDAFRRVLLDAPCSGLGTLRRNPEIRWRLAPRDLGEYMRTQRHLLRSAAECVMPGGRLVYSVCTVTPEENELVVADLLKNRPDFTPAPPLEGGPAAFFAADGFFRTFPDRHGMDGFFAAVLDRSP